MEIERFPARRISRMAEIFRSSFDLRLYADLRKRIFVLHVAIGATNSTLLARRRYRRPRGRA